MLGSFRLVLVVGFKMLLMTEDVVVVVLKTDEVVAIVVKNEEVVAGLRLKVVAVGSRPTHAKKKNH